MRELFRDAEAGNPYACLALAYFMQTGKELDQDLEEAVLWYERAAMGGCARAHWELYNIYSEGEIVEQDTGLAIEHLMKSAEIGNIQAQKQLAKEYYLGNNLDVDHSSTFKWYMRAAEQGDSEAKFVVGHLYHRGVGVGQSHTDAEMWYSSVGMTGDADMFLEFGLRYEYGFEGISEDLVEAARWYKSGVDMGHEKCLVCWNSVLRTLNGEPHESFETRMWRLSMTSSQRDVDARNQAMEEADELFDAGEEEVAFERYSMAADLGSPLAMFIVAMMRHQGVGVKRDDLEGIKALSRAANAGSEDAQFYLARTYESDRFPTDDSQIVKLYADAANNGFLAAYYYLSKYVDHPEVYARRVRTRR